MLERIRLILTTHDLTASVFADQIGVQRSSVSHVLSGRNNPSLDFVQKILKRYPDINTEWLVNGTGPMTKDRRAEVMDAPLPVKPESDMDLFNSPPPAKKQVYFSESIESKPPVVQADPVTNNDGQTVDATAKAIEKQLEKSAKTDAERVVEKVMIFYSDHTFKVYHPQ